jgi:5-(carboxyamino)imidazole ribonucleotide synthase
MNSIFVLSMKHFYDTFKLGILGGGQLGRMLLQKAADFNISNSILDPDPNAPCKNLTDEFVLGDFNDHDTVLKFGRKVDLLTIEIEHVNVEALEQLEKEGILVYPQSRTIKLVQDKGNQKIFYRTNKIPTAEFHLIENRSEIEKYANQFPLIQKLRKGGYDGKGVMKLKSVSDIKNGFDSPSILEKHIEFEKEISVIVARNLNGEIKTFPVVDMLFNSEANLVEYLFSPADLNESIQNKAESIAMQVAESLQIIGVLAVEMFVLKNGELLVNEIAPRPHNSGHHSIEANVTSQYEQHLRAILNLPLGNTDILQPSVMVNLLGEKGFDGHARYEGLNEAMKLNGVKVHLYGKKITKPFRKMGHITVVSTSLEDAKEKAEKIKDMIKIIA